MRIGLIVHDLHDSGGHSRYTRVLAEGLSRVHEVAVFANRCERPTNATWRSHHVRAWRNSSFSTVQTFPLGLRAHRKQLADYDIRHAQGYCGGNPNVVTAHICAAAYLDSLRALRLSNRASLKLMAAAEERFYRRYQGHVIAISQKIGDELRNRYQVKGSVSVVPHGVEANRFGAAGRVAHRSELRSELELSDDQTVALYVGDLTKAHVYLKALSEKVPKVQLVIVSGSTRYLWNAPNVRFQPPTRQLERYYAASDAFIFPTTYDAFGLVVLEAMASGLPVFCSDQAGAAELITSGRDGFVISLNDWVETTAAALNDGKYLHSIGLEAEQTARQHDWPSVVQRVEDLYFQILNGAGERERSKAFRSPGLANE